PLGRVTARVLARISAPLPARNPLPGRREPRGGGGLSIDEVVAQVNELEGGRHVEERLGVAEEQEAARQEALVERVDDAAPRGVVEVDEDVPAEDDVDAPDHGGARRVEQVQL